MSIFDSERALQTLQAQRADIESRSHDGYTDAARLVRLESEMEAVEQRIVREKQRAERGEG